MLYYAFEIQHVSTNKFGCADLLSLLIDRTNQFYKVIAALSLEDGLESIISDTAKKVPVSFAALCRAKSINATAKIFAKPSETVDLAAPRIFPLQFNSFQRCESLIMVDGYVRSRRSRRVSTKDPAAVPPRPSENRPNGDNCTKLCALALRR